MHAFDLICVSLFGSDSDIVSAARIFYSSYQSTIIIRGYQLFIK